MFISNSSHLEIELYCEKSLCIHSDHSSKRKIIVFDCHLFIYRLWHVRSSIFGHYLRLLFWCNWKQSLIHQYSTIFYPFLKKVEWYQLITMNTVNFYWKHSHFRSLMLWEYIEIIFQFRFRIFLLINLMFFGSVMKNCVFIFWKRLRLLETSSFF